MTHSFGWRWQCGLATCGQRWGGATVPEDGDERSFAVPQLPQGARALEAVRQLPLVGPTAMGDRPGRPPPSPELVQHPEAAARVFPLDLVAEGGGDDAAGAAFEAAVK